MNRHLQVRKEPVMPTAELLEVTEVETYEQPTAWEER
jgi:hypothetical protein